MSESTTTTVAQIAQNTINSILAQVASKLGQSQAAALAPVITQYGPAFAAMTAADIWAWIDLAVKGDPFAAYAAIVAKLPNQDLVSEWSAINSKWQTANAQNAAAVAWQHDALGALLKALLAIASAQVVL